MAAKGNSTEPTRKDEIRKCETCKIRFSDIYSYVDHLESKDHMKQVMKNKYGEKYLEAKKKLNEKLSKDPTMTAPEEEPALPDKKPQSENDCNSEGSEDDNSYTCELCYKVCTGYLTYQLHLEGRKHQKSLVNAKLMKQLKENNLIPKTSEKKPPEDQSLMDRIMTKTQFASSDILCEPCQVKCCGPAAYQQHCKGAGHQKKLTTLGLLDKMKSEGVYPQQHDDESPFAHCHICQKDFSGPLPYQQHMESNTHLKQARHAEGLSKIKGLTISSDDDSKNILCKECGKSFNGLVPFHAHLKSYAHEKLKKKSARLEDLQKKHPELVKIPVQRGEDIRREDGVMLGCSICRLVCNGPEAARDHFSSDKHKQAVKNNKEFQKYLKQQKPEKLEASGSIKGRMKTVNDPQETESSDESEYDIIPEV